MWFTRNFQGKYPYATSIVMWNYPTDCTVIIAGQLKPTRYSFIWCQELTTSTISLLNGITPVDQSITNLYTLHMCSDVLMDV